jgi:hypothetical protein
MIVAKPVAATTWYAQCKICKRSLIATIEYQDKKWSPMLLNYCGHVSHFVMSDDDVPVFIYTEITYRDFPNLMMRRS